MRTLGLALGAGGLRGAAHVGVLSVLERNGIMPTVTTGSSAGAVVGALYAGGIRPERLQELARAIKPQDFLDVESLPEIALAIGKALVDLINGGLKANALWRVPNGLIRGEALQRYIAQNVEVTSFDGLPHRLVVVATQVDSGKRVLWADACSRQLLREAFQNSEDTVVLGNASLSAAVRASAAIPGIYEPVWWEQGHLVDGGVMDFVPVDAAFAAGADVVLAVDLGYAGERKDPIDNILEVVAQSIDILGRTRTDLRFEALSRAQKARTLRLKPRIYDVGLWETGRVEEVIERGAQAMEEALPALLRLLRS